MKRRYLSWLLGMLVPSIALADSQLNLTKGVTEVSNEVYGLHMLALYICTAIGVVVFGAMIWSMIFHRKSKGVEAATFHESTKVEVLWTVIPIIILIAMAVPATKTLIAMENNDNSDLTIQVTGSQWKWHYKYFDEDIEFYSVLSTPRDQYENHNGIGAQKSENYLLEVDKHLVIPANKKVRFLITSDDVIHSWWVPAFAVKQDANPGFINEAWTNVPKPGIYRGQCAELCGKDHGFMPIVVEVKTEADYTAWLKQQRDMKEQALAAEAASLNAEASMDELMQLGETTYTAYCAACHQPNGQGLPPAFPALKGSKIALGDVNEHINIVFNGKAGTGMQGYGKQLSLKEIAAVVTYERNAWGNDTGDKVQAADVNAFVGGSSAIESAGEQIKDAAEEVIEEVKDAAKAMVSEDLSKTYTMEELMAKGEQVYQTACLACHQAGGQGLPPAFPALKGGPIVTGDIAAHIDIVVNGSKKNPAMAAFGSTLSKTDIAAVITYERNAWGNNTGDLIQPADIDAASAK
ncbi:cytochrome c oxidase subunit II [Thalassotalea ganghwensis]